MGRYEKRIREIKERGFRDLFITLPILCFICFIIYLPFMIISNKPTCSIEEFYVPALNKAVSTAIPSNTIFLDIKLTNNNIVKGIKYGPINLTFYYDPNTSFPIGNYVVPGFYQGVKKNTNRREVAETRGVDWAAARGLVSNGSTTGFRVGLATSLRFKFLGVHYKKHKMVVGAKVQVDDSGEKVGKDGIKFKSGGTSVIGGGRCGWVGLVAVVTASVFLF